MPLLLQDSLGKSIAAIAGVVPDGLLVFFSSYSMMDRLQERWKVSAMHLPDFTLPLACCWVGCAATKVRIQELPVQSLAVACWRRHAGGGMLPDWLAPIEATGVILVLHHARYQG